MYLKVVKTYNIDFLPFPFRFPPKKTKMMARTVASFIYFSLRQKLLALFLCVDKSICSSFSFQRTKSLNVDVIYLSPLFWDFRETFLSLSRGNTIISEMKKHLSRFLLRSLLFDENDGS